MWWGVPVVKTPPPRGVFDHRWAPNYLLQGIYFCFGYSFGRGFNVV